MVKYTLWSASYKMIIHCYNVLLFKACLKYGSQIPNLLSFYNLCTKFPPTPALFFLNECLDLLFGCSCLAMSGKGFHKMLEHAETWHQVSDYHHPICIHLWQFIRPPGPWSKIQDMMLSNSFDRRTDVMQCSAYAVNTGKCHKVHHTIQWLCLPTTWSTNTQSQF